MWSNTFFDGEFIFETTLQKAGLRMITTCHNLVVVYRISLRDKRSHPRCSFDNKKTIRALRLVTLQLP